MTDQPKQKPGAVPDPDATIRHVPPRTDAEDLAATVPVAGWDGAATVAAPGRSADPDKTHFVDLNVDPALTQPTIANTGDATLPTIASAGGATLPTTPSRSAAGIGQDPTLVANFGPDPAAGAGALAATLPTNVAGGSVAGGSASAPSTPSAGSETGSGSSTYGRSASFTRTGRTRINLNLPAEARQLDEKLQLSRTSVLADMATARFGRGATLPPGVSKLISEQDTEGRYAITKPLAAGGMGAVLQIADHDFRRNAAMKVIHGRFAHNPEALERFLAEAQVTAQLEHPNIVPIHDLGVMEDGTLYFTMKLIEGQSLGSVVKALKAGDAAAVARWTLEERLLTFLKVLDGVGFAHSRGVVHRDLKPDNIMLGLHGEVLVVDWGIAKVMAKADQGSELVRQVASVRDQQSLAQTMAGSAMGTVFYMPPEQAKGALDEIDPRSDVYALGATLYELLSTRRCLDSAALPELIAKIVAGDFIPLDRVAPDLDADLVAVVHRAMALDRADRYQGCAEFAAELRRYLAGQAVDARRRNLIERIGQWYARHRRQVQVGAAMAVLMGAAVAGTVTVLGHQAQARAGQLLGEAREHAAKAKGEATVDELTQARDALVAAAGLQPARADIQELKTQVTLALAKAEDERKRAEQQQAAYARASQLLAESIPLKTAGKLAEAEEALSAAFKLAPTNAAIDEALKEVVRLRGNERDQILRREARDHRSRGDQALARAKALDALDDKVEDALKRAEAEFTLAEKDGVSVDGIQEQIKAAALLRERIAAARKRADDQRQGRAALAKAEAALAAKQFDQAKAAISQALGFMPGDQAADQLRLQILDQERTELAARAAAEKLRQSHEAGAKAKEALAAGNLAAARDLAAQAVGLAPADAEAVQLRDQVREAERAAARAAALAETRAKAAKAMDEARAELAKEQAEVARLRNAGLAVDKLTTELSGQTAERKAPLWQAHREMQAARSAASEHWSLTEAAAQNVLGFLAEQTQDPLYAEAKKLLADLYQARLVDARGRRDVASIAAFANLLRRYDDGRYASLLGDLGKLAISGPEGTRITLRAVDQGQDLRLVPVKEVMTITLPAKPLDLQGGHYQLESGEVLMGVVVSATAPLSLVWPGKLPAIAGMPLRYVPAGPATKSFLLGQYEVTQDQYHRFVTDPAVFAQVKASWKQVHSAGADANQPLLYIPRRGLASEETWQAVASDKEGLELAELRLPAELAGLPVTGISRDDAEAFCAWLGRASGLKVRLPSAAEWQFAAHGGDERRPFPWGEVFDGSLAVTAFLPGEKDKAREAPAKVGQIATDLGPFGHSDLAGNVREWLGDRTAGAGSHGALIAGGGWADDRADQFRTTSTEGVQPFMVNAVIGFRVLVDLP
jgi:formylglycine-generating enzyme required for sulfatase activity